MKTKPVAIPTPWYLAPLYARGQFSPRLLAAWIILWATVALEFLRPTTSPEIIWANTVFCAALFGLGTLQKIQLDSSTQQQTTQQPPAGEGENVTE